MIGQLEEMLVAITGYDAVSLQPNAGSQGEFAGLLAIRAYHRSRGDEQRTVCLIPSSAHGTNAASAVMAGMGVVVVACDDDGNVDLDDLQTKAAAAGDTLAGVMVTYPSTHGVFEHGIERAVRHRARARRSGVRRRGQPQRARRPRPARPVRCRRQPPEPAQDVLHPPRRRRTGRRPGRGARPPRPVPARAIRSAAPASRSGRCRRHRTARPGILPISWVYIALMGAEGLRDATATAILNANYVATRLDAALPGAVHRRRRSVGHECIIDLRPITKATGVTVDDVAKRLMDYGFHAPTMSFPVAGTLMIEPTESETHARARPVLRRDARRSASEIDRVAAGEWPLDDSPLRHAPHTADDLLGEWNRPYSRELGAYPVAALRAAKYFPPVSRIDAAYGDRNLMCTCEPLEAYAT